MIFRQIGGLSIPALGLGTWPLTGTQCSDIVAHALASGWRHIDTARRYENEKDVGAGIRAAGVARDAFHLTTKVWWDSLRHDDLIRSAAASLEDLGVEQVDLLLIHWPNPEIPLADSIAALLETKARGWTRAVGVSNFPSALMAEAQALAGGQLVTNQVEYHPFLSQKAVLAACERLDMTLTAYAPIARGQVNDSAVIRRIADRHGKTPVQVTLRWLVQQERVIAIPKTANPDRLAANAAIFDFELGAEEMAEISALGSPRGRTINLDWAPDWDTE
ncbi:aldo/keto reductase [Polymorphum gilvum]|uniref:Putative aldo/keto reductase putative 2, 5-diketo-D-gluconate reductase B (DkgB-like) n=1 Tax=Polymorphum gilvum (strain LMG 25793 / CGMCC 1.9160 / SL003B-26A1) TaxID=991905 RepID=F2IV11_POLGS|nr:aldo/keto reductase [Polymorphum gilvum]ADZ70240.1 Putative aldo/keto reductase; putative 2, 5-diketo-D-gluconate reductase B (DkgB-like) [Polymorphum gilvum SL003B-26A1]